MEVGITCGWCGCTNESGRRHCVRCGSDLSYDYAPNLAVQPLLLALRAVAALLLVIAVVVLAIVAAVVLMPA